MAGPSQASRAVTALRPAPKAIRLAAAPADLVTIDRTAVNPKVVRGGIGAAFGTFVAAYVLQLLGHWSLFTNLGDRSQQDVAAAVIAVIGGLSSFVVGYLTSHDQAIAAEVTHVLGADATAQIRTAVSDAVSSSVAGTEDVAAPATVVVQAPPTVVVQSAAPAAAETATPDAPAAAADPSPDDEASLLDVGDATVG